MKIPGKLLIPLSITLLVGLGIAIGYLVPPAIDWTTAFRPAVHEIFAGRSPYNISLFLNPPWALLPLIPLALLPEQAGRGLLLLISIISMIYTTKKLGAMPPAMVLVLLSPPFIHCLLVGNLEWLTCLGFVLPPQIGLFFISVKPQLGIVVGLFWLVEAWRKNGVRGVFTLIWPFTLVFLLSIAIFGFWPSGFYGKAVIWKTSGFFPEFVPLGLILIVAAFRSRKITYAMAAGPCLSPYTLFHSWIAALLAVCHSLPETIAAYIGLWIVMLITALG